MVSSLNQNMADILVTASVIVLNNNVAVALKYEEDVDMVPVIIAKGIDDMALLIEAIGRENGVSIVDDPFTVDLLYSSFEVGECIPDKLYAHVAEILINIYRSKKFPLNSD